jgi:hypothetical protein
MDWQRAEQSAALWELPGGLHNDSHPVQQVGHSLGLEKATFSAEHAGTQTSYPMMPAFLNLRAACSALVRPLDKSSKPVGVYS